MIKLDTEKEVCFVAKASKTRTRRIGGKDYTVFRLVVPKKAAESLRLGEKDSTGQEIEDILLLGARRAKWYHLLRWETMQGSWNLLDGDIRDEIRELGFPHPKDRWGGHDEK